MKNLLTPMLLVLLWAATLSGQQTFTASVYNNAVALPGGSFGGPLHPGFDVGWVKPLKTSPAWERMLVLRAGYYYQRVVHHGVQLYGEYQFRYRFTPSFAAEAAAGLGYVHTFELHDIFVLNSEGQYERTDRAGKPHVQASVALGLSYAGQDWPLRPFLQYRFRMITPFVRNYVPLLPATSLHLGLYFTIAQPE